MKATYQPISGFSDYEVPAQEVNVLSFIYGEYEPGYQRASLRRTLAVIALPDGRLREAELRELRMLPEKEPAR